MPKKYFFGWGNFKYNFLELKKMYSASTSFYSKKRIEGGVAFIIGEWGMVTWLILNATNMDVYQICIWAGVQFAICGYMVKQTEKAKANDTPHS